MVALSKNPLTEKDVPIEADSSAVWCGVCGRRGYKDSTMMMRISHASNAFPALWVHTDICWNKWHLRLEEEE